MFYKVIKNNKVIDVLDELIYLKYQPKNKIMVLTDEANAQAILASDKKTIWHEVSLYDIPADGYETVEAIEIDEFEYKKRKVLNGMSPEAIIDEYNLLLIEMGVI